MKTKIILTSLVLLVTSFLSLADDNKQGPSARQGPPPEAITACEDKNAGDSAEFSGRDGGSITGICEDMNGTLILRPDNLPKNQ